MSWSALTSLWALRLVVLLTLVQPSSRQRKEVVGLLAVSWLDEISPRQQTVLTMDNWACRIGLQWRRPAKGLQVGQDFVSDPRRCLVVSDVGSITQVFGKKQPHLAGAVQLQSSLPPVAEGKDGTPMSTLLLVRATS